MSSPLAILIGRATMKSRPLFASLELTYVCNLHCYFCYNPVQRKNQNRINAAVAQPRDPLSYEETVQILDQLKEMGVLYLTLTGGEPMLHPRFWDIAREAKARAFAMRVFSNGIIINETVADRLAELCPYCLEISIHGATDATAEALNKVPGSHQRLLKALGLLKERDIRVYLKCSVTKLVENELEQIQAIADSFGYPLYLDPVLTLSDDGEAYPLELQASDEALRRLYSSPVFHIGVSPFERKDGQPNCSVAMGTMNIDPFGNVSPCIQWKESVGNLRDQPLERIWTSSLELEKIRDINRRMNEFLEKTPDRAFCGHCPGLSQLRYGDPTRPEEQYLRMARIRKEVFGEQQAELVPTAATPVPASSE
jgi:radical SAM protein with 4Fe4S-binding SPASM domain